MLNYPIILNVRCNFYYILIQGGALYYNPKKAPEAYVAKNDPIFHWITTVFVYTCMYYVGTEDDVLSINSKVVERFKTFKYKYVQIFAIAFNGQNEKWIRPLRQRVSLLRAEINLRRRFFCSHIEKSTSGIGAYRYRSVL